MGDWATGRQGRARTARCRRFDVVVAGGCRAKRSSSDFRELDASRCEANFTCRRPKQVGGSAKELLSASG
jgi:hypothetical protein